MYEGDGAYWDLSLVTHTIIYVTATIVSFPRFQLFLVATSSLLQYTGGSNDDYLEGMEKR